VSGPPDEAYLTALYPAPACALPVVANHLIRRLAWGEEEARGEARGQLLYCFSPCAWRVPGDESGRQ